MLRSWDIFDTLIARRCIFPQNVFKIVEQISKINGFMNVRIAAEQSIIKEGKNFKLDDIYDVMTKISNVSDELADKLKKLECDIEVEQAIPITENLNKIKSGDILISDMYLPEEVIRRILDKVGLFVPVEIVITSGGKANGKIWQQLKNQNAYIFHTGDNEISDVKNPRQFGFDSSWTVLNRLNQFENLLLEKDFEFATYLRELRLRNPFVEDIKRIYWTIFIINVGILMLFVKQIDSIQKKFGFEYLGFCGRDTFYLYQLYKKLKKDKGEELPITDYLHYSRKLIINSQKEATKYFSSRMENRKSLLIDLLGTGLHFNKLREKINNPYSILICGYLGQRISSQVYGDENFPKNWVNIDEVAPNEDIKNLNFYIDNCDKDKSGWSENVEVFNRSVHNSPLRIKTFKLANKVIPEVSFSEVNDTENLDVFKTCMKEILNSKIQWSKFENYLDIDSILKVMLQIFETYAKRFVLRNEQDVQENADKIIKIITKNLK